MTRESEPIQRGVVLGTARAIPSRTPLTGISKCLRVCKVMTRRKSILSRLPMKEDRGITYTLAPLPTGHAADLCSIESGLLGPAPQNPVQSSQGNAFIQLIKKKKKNGLTPYDPCAVNTPVQGNKGKQKDPKRNWFKIKSCDNVFKEYVHRLYTSCSFSIPNPNLVVTATP